MATHTQWKVSRWTVWVVATACLICLGRAAIAAGGPISTIPTGPGLGTTVVNPASAPAKLILTPGYATLEAISYTHSAPAQTYDGAATLKLALPSGKDTYTYSVPNTAFSGVAADATGQVTAGTLTLPAGSFSNFLGTGLNVAWTSGATVPRAAGVGPRAGTSPAPTEGTSPAPVGANALTLTLKMVITTPFNDANGNPFAIDLEEGSPILRVDATGATTLGGGVGKSHFESSDTAKINNGSFLGAGMRIIPESVNLTLSSSPTAAVSYTMTCPTGRALCTLPGLVTVGKAPLTLAFTDLTMSDQGEVSVTAMNVPANGSPEDVALADPADFILRVSSAVVTLEKSVPTSFSLEAAPVLPTALTDQNHEPAEMPAVWFDLLTAPVVDLEKPTPVGFIHGKAFGGRLVELGVSPARTGPGAGTSPAPSGGSGTSTAQTGAGISPALQTRTFYFNGFAVEITDLLYDFSHTAPDDPSTTEPGITAKNWQGVFARTAHITLPTKDWSTSKGQPITLNATNCFIDTNGFTGTVDAPAADLADMTIHGFNAHLKNLHLVFGRNNVLDTDCKGTAAVPGFSGSLNLVIKVGTEGTSARVEEPGVLSESRLGLGLSVTSGTLEAGSDGKYALWLNGALSEDVPESPSLKSSALSFHALGLADDGQFVTAKSDDWLTLDTPANVDFDVLHCNISSLAFRRTDGGNPQDAKGAVWVIDMNGEMSLATDFPVSSTVTYDTLQIAQGAKATDPPFIVCKNIGVNADLFKVAKVTAVLNKGERDGNPCLTGDATLALTFLGQEAVSLADPDAQVPTPHFQLYIGAGDTWAVVGDITLPAPIPLGTTGLDLDRFRGGAAHNMAAPANGDFGSVNDLTPTKDGSYLFTAGVGVEMDGGSDVFHASGRLTLGIPSFSFNIHGDAWLLTDSWSEPGTGTVDIWVDTKTPAFGADVGLDLGFPSPDILKISGAVGIYISPHDQHVQIGWPYPANACGCDVLSGVITATAGADITPTSTQVCAGAGFNYWVFKGSINADFGYNFAQQPYLYGSIWASGEVDFYVASIGASASLSGELYSDRLDFSGTFTATIGLPWPLPDIHASVDFSGSV